MRKDTPIGLSFFYFILLCIGLFIAGSLITGCSKTDFYVSSATIKDGVCLGYASKVSENLPQVTTAATVECTSLGWFDCETVEVYTGKPNEHASNVVRVTVRCPTYIHCKGKLCYEIGIPEERSEQ